MATDQKVGGSNPLTHATMRMPEDVYKRQGRSRAGQPSSPAFLFRINLAVDLSVLKMYALVIEEV